MSSRPIHIGAAAARALRAARPVGHSHRVADAAAAITAHPPDDPSFQHSVFAQISLPARQPPSNVRNWTAQNGSVFCSIDAGSAINPATGERLLVPLPWGVKARLVLIYLNTEAVRTASPEIDVRRSLTAFTRELLGRAPKGRELRLIKTQLLALSAAHVTMAFLRAGHVDHHHATILDRFQLWASDLREQRFTWPRRVTLSARYFASLVKHAIPLDPRAISGLAHSALALDQYVWLAQRLHRVTSQRPQVIRWAALHDQFARRPARLDDFRREFRRTLRSVLHVYPAARVEDLTTARGWPVGLKLLHSPPPVKPRPFPRANRAQFLAQSAPISSESPITTATTVSLAPTAPLALGVTAPSAAVSPQRGDTTVRPSAIRPTIGSARGRSDG